MEKRAMARLSSCRTVSLVRLSGSSLNHSIYFSCSLCASCSWKQMSVAAVMRKCLQDVISPALCVWELSSGSWMNKPGFLQTFEEMFLKQAKLLPGLNFGGGDRGGRNFNILSVLSVLTPLVPKCLSSWRMWGKANHTLWLKMFSLFWQQL